MNSPIPLFAVPGSTRARARSVERGPLRCLAILLSSGWIFGCAEAADDVDPDNLVDGGDASVVSESADDASMGRDASIPLPPAPSREQVLSAMKSVTPSVQACAGSQRGVAMTRVFVLGATGEVAAVDVTGVFAGTSAASCIRREVQRATFDMFSQTTFSFSYPFKLGGSGDLSLDDLLDGALSGGETAP